MHLGRDLDGVSAEKLESSLAKLSPELKQCVASCKHIAETARGQNHFQSVSATFIPCFIYVIMIGSFFGVTVNSILSRRTLGANDSFICFSYRRMKSGSCSPE